jgi:NAD dependent epimerase/dehydratase family enzyme
MDFSRMFAGAFNRKTRLRVPGSFLRIILGEASAVLTDGQSVYPRRIIDSGYTFKYPSLENTLKDIVN